MLYRSQLICLEEDVFSTVNIRLRLKDYQFKKRLRKTLNRNNRKFRSIIKRASLNEAKERLYRGQKHRFKGFIFDSLHQFFFANLEESVFDTYEVCVYDGDKLIAVSFFDQGKSSLASILGLYDQDYEKSSLGLYTMLLEVDYALDTNRKYYYPGYVLDRPSVFDYKLRLGEEYMEYYNWKGKWKAWDRLNKEKLLVHDLKEKMEELETCLQAFHIDYQKILYPLFSIGYLVFFGDSFLRCSVYLTCLPHRYDGPYLIVEYLLEEQVFRLSWSSECPEYQEFINMKVSKDLGDPNLYCLHLLKYDRIIIEDELPHKIAHKIQKITWRK